MSEPAEERFRDDSGRVLDDQGCIREHAACVTSPRDLVGRPDEAERAVERRRRPGAELERSPVVLEGAEGNDDRPGSERPTTLDE
jgi:hypothetical protein